MQSSPSQLSSAAYHLSNGASRVESGCATQVPKTAAPRTPFNLLLLHLLPHLPQPPSPAHYVHKRKNIILMKIPHVEKTCSSA
ncbi:hypothetical protein GOP47_0000282 [Adiantum capillus-veneris]|uniref:Uncharacterized protein n=1 Tax=Adiantum capillus-veneris TaxID=13818 RepID=A0A9D4ZQK5_ADICA|nr:hypothetical protein GOP47_0000282 [Adiantum capillus-veneris]